MSKADENDARRKLGRLLGLEFQASKFRLGDWGQPDGWVQVAPSAFLFLEIEGGQKHPCTNVLKLWPWLEEHTQARVLLLHAYLPGSPGLTNNRGRLATWIGERMQSALGDRFRRHRFELVDPLPPSVADALIGAFRAFASGVPDPAPLAVAGSGSLALVARIVEQLRAAVSQLEELFPGRPFTLDGHLVGSIGEVLAAERYGLELLSPSTQDHDAKAPDGLLVQVKLTRGDSVGLSSESQHLLVLGLMMEGTLEEIYNGPGRPAWDAAGPMQKNGHKQVSVSRLMKLMEAVPPAQRLRLVNGEQES